jgi:hypothetical protein
MAALHIGDPVTAFPSEDAPVVWILHDGKPGMASQALGLAEATGFPSWKSASVLRPWSWLPPQLWLGPLHRASEGGVRLAPPWPDLVIGCGRHSAKPALAIAAPAAGGPSPRRSRIRGLAATNSTCCLSPSTTGCAVRVPS